MELETFTLHDMLIINSTDLNKILCSLGIRNISDCEIEQGSSNESKGRLMIMAFFPSLFFCSLDKKRKQMFVSYISILVQSKVIGST